MINKENRLQRVPFPLLLERGILHTDRPLEEKEEVIRKLFRSSLAGQKTLANCVKCAVT
jgi:hypothetical protein